MEHIVDADHNQLLKRWGPQSPSKRKGKTHSKGETESSKQFDYSDHYNHPNQTQQKIMSVILTKTKPPLEEVTKLGRRSTEIYLILFTSAARDFHYDKNKSLPYEHRRDCGGTTSWSIQALACKTNACRKLVTNAIGKLLDAGFITVVGMAKSNVGKRQ